MQVLYSILGRELYLLVWSEEPLQRPGELVRVLLLQVKSEELHVLLEEPLTTQTNSVSFGGRSGGVEARGWKFLNLFLNISKHQCANKLGVVVDKVTRTKTRLNKIIVWYKIR